MDVSIFGLGYVGTVTSACLAKLGHRVIGVDTNRVKVGKVKRGESPIVEKDLDELLERAHSSHALSATTSCGEAVSKSEVSLVCVGTPGREDGAIELGYIKKVCREIGRALRTKSGRHTVVVRSTVLPGTVEKELIPLLERSSGRKVGARLGVVFNPEFLREGSAVDDFFNPPFTVIGGEGETAKRVSRLYEGVEAPLIYTTMRTAEMVKYACNIFHALKVCFGNEIGRFCKSLQVDSHEVMRIFMKDKHLNISPAYLLPGFAYGGSCLGKDLRAVLVRSAELKVELPLFRGIERSNRAHIEQALSILTGLGRKKVGVLGLSFKSGTDDLRQSPIIPVIGALVGRGFEVQAYDRNIELSRMLGANLQVVENEIPYLASILGGSLEEVVRWAEVIVIANKSSEFLEVVRRIGKGKTIVDLVRINDELSTGGDYIGMCW